MITLRVLTPEDWPLWRELRLAALAEAPYAFGSTLADWAGDRDREERWRARLAVAGSRNFIALLDGRPAGMASGAPDGEDAAELLSMWVSPWARGRGVGDSLIAAVEDWARQVPVSTLRLAVAEGNERAAAFYRRHGFALTGEPAVPMPDGARQEQIMAKSIAQAPGS